MKSKAESVIQKVCSVVIVLYIIVQYILLLVLKYCSHLHIQHHFLKLCFNTLDWKEERIYIPDFHTSLAKAINNFFFGDKYVISYMISDLNKETEQPKAISPVVKLCIHKHFRESGDS